MDIVTTKMTESLSTYGVQNQNITANSDTTSGKASKQEERALSSADRQVEGKSTLKDELTRELNADTTKVISELSDNIDKPEIEREALLAASEQIQSFMQSQNRNLAFTVDESTKRAVVTVSDAESGDVIRQIPSEEVLRLASRIQELQQDIGNRVGVLLNNKV